MKYLCRWKKIRVFHDRDASKLPWSEEGVEIVMECTGKYRDAEEAKGSFESTYC